MDNGFTEYCNYIHDGAFGRSRSWLNSKDYVDGRRDQFLDYLG